MAEYDMSGYNYCQRIAADLQAEMKKPLVVHKRYLIVNSVPPQFMEDIEQLVEKLNAKGLKARLSRNTLIVGWEHL